METGWLLPDKKIWFKQDQTYTAGTIIDRIDAKKQVQIITLHDNKKVIQSFSKCFQRSSDHVDYEDMCNMNILNEPQILANLRQRYLINKIYTKIGPTLIALNPYKSIESLYQKEIMMNYKQIAKKDQIPDDVIPHVYSTASGAYCNLKVKGKKQAIVISGQSGAGKTENTKYCMKFLTSLSHVHQKNQKQKAIEDVILECNPILQAFGNSKTVRNSNSSRFGKYVRLFISLNQQITGARVQNYLLQKSRVTSVSKKQRTFHIFYYLINSDRESAGLFPGEKYQYLQSSGCFTAQGIDDKCSFKILKTALEDVGFSKNQINNIWLALGSILLIGNLEFDNKQNLTSQSNLCKYSDQKLVVRICKNLGLSINDLNDLVLQQKHMIGKQVMIKKYNQNQCILAKNTLAKSLYSRIFDYLIEKINDKLWIDKKDDRSISILDIFGFELFDKNSIEQLCINFTNERLQQLYTKYVFENQILELKKDGLADKVKDLIPPDNKPIIELIEKRMGISVFSLIDQKTALGAAKDEDIVSQLRKIKHKNLYVDPQPNKTAFMILHTQNPVVYLIEGFKYKNQDSVTPQIDRLINRLFPIVQSQEFKGKTLVSKFDKQLKSLNEELQSSQLHFIRCIKPNEEKKANFIDDRFVLQQIKYLGVLETIQIRKTAYPFRTSFHHFIQNYKDFVPFDKAFNKLSQAEQCVIVLKKMIPGIEKQRNSYLLGKQKIYLKESMEVKLNLIALQSFKKRSRAANKIQKQFIRYKQRAKLLTDIKIFVSKIKFLQRLLLKKIKKSKLLSFAHFKSQVKKIKEQQIRIKSTSQKQLQEAKRKQREKQQYQQNLLKNKKVEKVLSVLTSNKSTDYQTKRDYETALYDTVQTVYNQIPESPVKIIKPSAPEYKSTTLSQSYLNYQSVVNQDVNTLVKGELRIPLYEKNQTRIKKLKAIITHTENNNMTQQDPNFDIIPSADDKTAIDPILLKGQLGHRIINFEYMAFFEKVLKKRKTLFGRKKGIAETLTAKDSPIGKSLLHLAPEQESKALEVFKLLVLISDSHKTDKIYQPIQKIVQLMQNTSQMLKNQIFVQLIKQQNVKNEYSSIKMYQIMAIYIHLFTIEEGYLMAYLSCLLQRHDDPATYDKIRQFICYIFPRVLRQITLKQIPIYYMPVQFQLAALMCKRQVPVSVYFSIGNSVIVKVESFECLIDIKERVLQAAGINQKRIVPDMVGFFEVMSFDNEELEENPLDDNKNIWDLLTYWEKAKCKFQQTSVKPPQFGLYFKIKYAFELTIDDQEGVQLAYAQTYFDLFIGRLKIPVNKLLQCSAMMKAIEPSLDIDFILPTWAVQDAKSKQQFMISINKLTQKYKNMSIHQIHFEFIRNCSSCPLCMSIAFSTDGNTKLYLKPKRLFIVENDEIIEEIGIRRVLRWGCDDTTLMLTIKDNSSERVMTIKSQYAKTIGAYLSTSMKLIMALKSN